jgi:hypothetical protein
MGQKSQACFDKMAMLAFSNAVLLGGMRTRHPMRDTDALKIAMQPMILTTPIGLNSFNFCV